jgi:hypothetical protein
MQVKDDVPTEVPKATGDAAFERGDFSGAITAWRLALAKSISTKHGVHGEAVPQLLALRSEFWAVVRLS